MPPNKEDCSVRNEWHQLTNIFPFSNEFINDLGVLGFWVTRLRISRTKSVYWQHDMPP